MTNSLQVVANSDVIFVAVKPQYVSLVLTEVRPVLSPNSVIVSIAAGVTLETLKVGVFVVLVLVKFRSSK